MRARADGRLFAWALAASVALHALLLAAWWPRQQSLPLAARSAPVVARLAEVQIPDAPPAEVHEQPKLQPKAPITKSAPIAKPAEAAKPARQEAAQAPSAPPPAAPAPTASAHAPVASVPPDRTAVDAYSAAQYRLQLIGSARRSA